MTDVSIGVLIRLQLFGDSSGDTIRLHQIKLTGFKSGNKAASLSPCARIQNPESGIQFQSNKRTHTQRDGRWTRWLDPGLDAVSA